MEKTPLEVYEDHLIELIEKSTDFTDIHSDEATAAIKNLKTFSECRPPQPDPDPDPEPTTFWGQTKCAVARVWDNETTRVLIKAGGAFAGVAAVAYSTIHKDHVLERQALNQANQRPM